VKYLSPGTYYLAVLFDSNGPFRGFPFLLWA
jgi:hypothetical protein